MKDISSRPYIDVIDESSASDAKYIVCHYFFCVCFRLNTLRCGVFGARKASFVGMITFKSLARLLEITPLYEYLTVLLGISIINLLN